MPKQDTSDDYTKIDTWDDKKRKCRAYTRPCPKSPPPKIVNKKDYLLPKYADISDQGLSSTHKDAIFFALTSVRAKRKISHLQLQPCSLFVSISYCLATVTAPIKQSIRVVEGVSDERLTNESQFGGTLFYECQSATFQGSGFQTPAWIENLNSTQHAAAE